MKRPREHRALFIPGTDRCASGAARRDDAFHLAERLGLDLAAAFGRDAELRGEIVQRCGILLLEPARLDDATAARVEAGERFLQPRAAQILAVFLREETFRPGMVRCKIANWRVGPAIVVASRLERDVLPGEP